MTYQILWKKNIYRVSLTIARLLHLPSYCIFYFPDRLGILSQYQNYCKVSLS